MIVGKPLAAPVFGGLKPKIVVTSQSGSTVKLDGVTGTEVSGVWTFDNVSLGNHTVTATNYGRTISKVVNVDKTAIFNVSILITVTVNLTGSFSSSYGYVTIDGIKYSAAGSHDVAIGREIGITVSSASSSQLSRCNVTLNGTTVQSGDGTYNYLVNEDCTITFAAHSSFLYSNYYTAAITI